MPLTKEQWDARLAGLISRQEELLARPNPREDLGGGIYDRYRYPVLTAAHAPLIWRYDICYDDDPFLAERLGVNSVFNAGAVYFDNRYYLIARVEGADGKSFFAAAESDKPTEGFRFREYPILLPDTCSDETDVYDMQITKHEDGWIYGVFCSESGNGASGDMPAQAGVVRTKDLMNWERLPNLTAPSPNRRCCCLHPEFVDGKYAFYTRLHDGYFTAGGDSGICFATCEDITEPVLRTKEKADLPSERSLTAGRKNGAGAVPIKTPRGWIHIAHGVRATAAGLRYIIYTFATDLNDPSKVIAAPGGQLIAPRGQEHAADVPGACFTNGCIVKDENVYIYYSSSDTQLHVASTTIEKLMDYTFNTPEDPFRSVDSVKRRWDLVDKNLDNGAKSI